MTWALVVAMVTFGLDALVAVYGVVVGDTSMFLDLVAHALFVLFQAVRQLRAETLAAATRQYAAQPYVPEQPVAQPEQV